MLLTFDRSTRTLIGFNDILTIPSNLTHPKVRYYDKYVILVDYPEVDHIETYSENELEYIVENQYELPDEIKSFVELYESKHNAEIEAKEIYQKHMFNATLGYNYSYLVEMNRLANTDVTEFERDLIVQQANILKQEVEQFLEQVVETYQTVATNFCLFNVYFTEFKLSLEQAENINAVLNALDVYKMAIKLI